MTFIRCTRLRQGCIAPDHDNLSRPFLLHTVITQTSEWERSTHSPSLKADSCPHPEDRSGVPCSVLVFDLPARMLPWILDDIGSVSKWREKKRTDIKGPLSFAHATHTAVLFPLVHLGSSSRDRGRLLKRLSQPFTVRGELSGELSSPLLFLGAPLLLSDKQKSVSVSHDHRIPA
jgi:hypothetical protein